ncbi:Penicillin-binding protein 2D [Ruegeria denitrificans]|uniref:peptidoglycan glycosyltransferase n=1 Tax=Ruegeria denitrificans TaxID=1715692 RepID=A0A0P1IB03_9RHOB|nr:PBP1A family penicillin-binding protein [Ruegeria denitrificans]CUK02710.1 Penicillin-binding protein 2D [Ruegeria denitrificans]
MTESRRRKAPLVADKRYPSKRRKPTATKRAAKPAGKKAVARKTTTRKTTRKKTRRKSGGGGGGIFRRFFRWVWRLIWGVTWRVGAVAAMLLALAVGVVYTTLPDVNELLDGRARGSVTLLDRDGKVFAWRGDQFGGVITAGTVSPHLKNAVVATEDRRFYRHFGVSPRGVASAVRINLSEGRGPLSGHGGSTITQQTAKLLCLGVPYVPSEWESEAAYESDCRQGSLWRKGKEAVYAIAMEVKYSKDEILTIYLNRAFLGAGARGFEAASQRYFGISAAEVNPAQAAMLAGLLVAPTRYAPTNNLQRSQDRARLVLGLMEAQDYLTTAQASSARSNPAQLSEAAAARAGGYFADWVITELPSYFGADTTDDVVIKTTLDQRLQKSAEEALKYIFQEKVREGSEAQAAIVVMSADGAVRAMVGGRQTRVSGAFNRATQALRQTGSSFKPFVYATALELGYSPLDTVVDEPYCVNIPGSGEWCPKNYTHKFYGRVTLADALKNSLNIPAVKVAEISGLDNVRTVASEFGIESDLAQGPALALGASESTLIEMTGAYAGILNGGSAVEPYGLSELKLLEDDAPVMVTSSGIGERVINDKAAKQLTWMMERVVSEGTGARAQLPGWQVAGKTGTTQAARDAWFIGFTADYVAGVWMGYDDNTPLSGVTGGGLPAEIWKETMLRVTEGMTPTPLPMLAPDPPVKTAQPQRQRRQGRAFEDAINNLFKNIFGN